MNNKKATVPWNENELMSGFSEDQLKHIEEIITNEEFIENESILTEGDVGDHFYLVVEGEVVIYKEDERFTLASLHAGNSLGVMAVVDNAPRSASAKAATKVKLAKITLSSLKELGTDDYNSINQILIKNHLNGQQKKLRSANCLTVDSLKEKLTLSEARVATGNFIVSMVFLLVVYSFAMRYILDNVDMSGTTTFITVGIIIFFSLIILIMIKKSPYPISYYGLRLDSWKKNLKESLLWSSGFILVISIAKLVYINTIASESNDPFFQLTDIKDKSFLFSLTFISLYSIFSIFQEFITRSGVQSPLLRFLTGKYVNTKAIILSTLLFASTHLHLNSIAFAIVVIVPGIFWGIMYARQNSLLGVSVSHILIGVWGAFIMGFPGSY